MQEPMSIVGDTHSFDTVEMVSLQRESELVHVLVSALHEHCLSCAASHLPSTVHCSHKGLCLRKTHTSPIRLALGWERSQSTPRSCSKCLVRGH